MISVVSFSIVIILLTAECLISFRNIQCKLLATKARHTLLASTSKQNIFDGLTLSNSTLEIIEALNFYDAVAIKLLGIPELKALGISSVDSANIIAWAERKIREKEKEEARLLDISKREKREEDMKVRIALKLASRKTISILHDGGKVLDYAIEDQLEFDKVLSNFSGLQEVNLDTNVLGTKAILSWEDLHDQKMYVPVNTKRTDVENLRAEIMNLAKSKAEFSAKSHLQEHFDLNSISDVEFLGSEIELRAKSGTVLGDVDTLYRIRSHSLFVLMERKTSVGVNATASLEEQVCNVIYIHSYSSIT